MGTAFGVSVAVALLGKGSPSGWAQGDFRIRRRPDVLNGARDQRRALYRGGPARGGAPLWRLQRQAGGAAGAHPDVKGLADSQREAELQAMKVTDLKELCRTRSLRVSGKKAELVMRLVEHEATEEEEIEEDEADSYGHSSDYDDDEEEDGLQGPDLSRKEQFMKALDKEAILETDDLESLFDIRMPEPGEVVTGIVTSLVEWGAFVELDDSGWSGLIHISEVSGDFVDSIEDHLQPGQAVEALVIRAPQERLDRLSLSLRRLERQQPEAPTTEAQKPEVDPTMRYQTAAQVMRRSVAEAEMQRLELRLNAVEAVLIQMGHGGALEKARQEILDGTRKPAVPEWSLFMEQSITEEPSRQKVAEERERLEIDAILADLMPRKEGEEADGQSRGSGLVPTGLEELEFEIGEGMGQDDVNRRIMGDMF